MTNHRHIFWSVLPQSPFRLAELDQVYHILSDLLTLLKSIIYIWDDFNIVAETINTLQSTIRNYNVWGLDLSQSHQGAGGIGGLLAVISPLPLGEGQGEGSMALACYDANGNIAEYVSTNGTISAHYE